jgi:hypothetical protein
MVYVTLVLTPGVFIGAERDKHAKAVDFLSFPSLFGVEDLERVTLRWPGLSRQHQGEVEGQGGPLAE